MKQKLLILSIAAILAGCGSDSNDSPAPVTDGGGNGGNGGGGDPVELVEVSGAALAPGGMLSQWQPQSSFQVVMNFLISPAAAAITGLTGVSDATVELFRVGSDGERTGEVLDSASTDADGKYTLELPEGQALGGDLVVEISSAGKRMRAQALSEDVNVSPVSEFVMRKLVASGTDLSAVSKEAVADLTETIEQLDLSATDKTIDEMIADLDNSIGDLVEESIELIAAEPADADSVAGDYRNVAVQWGLEAHDDWDSYALDTWVTDATLVAGENGTADAEFTGEANAFMSLGLTGAYIFHEAESEDYEEAETLTFNFSDTGVLSFSQPEEEEMEGSVAERIPAKVYKFRQVPSANMFVLEGNDVKNYYEAIDSNQDGEPDTFGDTILGQDAFRGIEFLTKKPAEATTADLEGVFGRVYIGTSFYGSGWLEIESEQNLLTFDGNGLLDVSAAAQYYIERDSNGNATQSSCQVGDADCAEAEPDLAYALGADGQFTNIGGGMNPSIFVNDGFNFLVGSEMEAIDEDGVTGIEEARHSITLAVKLPTTGTPTIDEKVYRVLQVENEFAHDLSLNTLRPSSILTMQGQELGSLDATISEVEWIDADSLLNMETGMDEDLEVSVAHGSNGAVTLTIDNMDGDALVMQGFLNEDGSFGILQTRYTVQGETAPTGLGIAVLIEVSE